MIWKKYDDYYDLSDTGLIRRRHSKPGYPKGLLLSPTRGRAGVASYHLTKPDGRRSAKTIKAMLKETFGECPFELHEKWINQARDKVNKYNIKHFGRCSKVKANEKNESRMWEKFNDPWPDWKPYGCEGIVSNQQLYPLG